MLWQQQKVSKLSVQSRAHLSLHLKNSANNRKKRSEKKEAERQFIDIPIAENTEQISVPAEKKFFLYGKNKVDAAVIFLKAFLLKARLNCA